MQQKKEKQHFCKIGPIVFDVYCEITQEYLPAPSGVMCFHANDVELTEVYIGEVNIIGCVDEIMYKGQSLKMLLIEEITSQQYTYKYGD